MKRAHLRRYTDIQRQILKAPVVEADETRANVNGGKNWFHTYQTPDLTFIGFHPSRCKKVQEYFYPEGPLYAILVTDCLAMQLSTLAAAHQICLAHILRELYAFLEAYPEEPLAWENDDSSVESAHPMMLAFQSKRDESCRKGFCSIIEVRAVRCLQKDSGAMETAQLHTDKVFTFLHCITMKRRSGFQLSWHIPPEQYLQICRNPLR